MKALYIKPLSYINCSILQQVYSNKSQEKQEKIQKLCESWAELDDENEQKETLKIIESLEGVLI